LIAPWRSQSRRRSTEVPLSDPTSGYFVAKTGGHKCASGPLVVISYDNATKFVYTPRMPKDSKRPSNTDINVRIPMLLKKELHDHAREEMTSANALIRKFVRDGLDDAKKKEK
jgi:hypothetical protein